MKILREYFNAYRGTSGKAAKHHAAYFVITGTLVFLIVLLQVGIALLRGPEGSLALPATLADAVWMTAALFGGMFWMFGTLYIERGVLLKQRDDRIAELERELGEFQRRG